MAALPNELYVDILTRVLTDSAHEVCFPKYETDLTWDLNALSTLSSVSCRFQDITASICQKIYGSPDRGKNLVQSANAKLAFLRQSQKRDVNSLKPIIFDEETSKTPFLQCYVLLLSIIQMRTIMTVPATPTLFRRMHNSIHRSIAMLQAITMSFRPQELYLNLCASSHMQKELISISSELVDKIDDLQEDLTILQEFNPEINLYDNGITKHMYRCHSILVQEDVKKYEEIAAVASHLTGPEVKVYQLPGVTDTMKRIRVTISPFAEYDMALDMVILEILDEIIDGWPMEEPT